MKSKLSLVHFLDKLNAPCPRALAWKLAVFVPTLGLVLGGLEYLFYVKHLPLFLSLGVSLILPTLWLLSAIAAFFDGFLQPKDKIGSSTTEKR